jgi:hypothetical protein
LVTKEHSHKTASYWQKRTRNDVWGKACSYFLSQHGPWSLYNWDIFATQFSFPNHPELPCHLCLPICMVSWCILRLVFLLCFSITLSLRMEASPESAGWLGEHFTGREINTVLSAPSLLYLKLE